MNKFNFKNFLLCFVVSGIMSGALSLVRDLILYKQHGWAKAWKIDKDELGEYPKEDGSNIVMDFDRQKLIDYSTGEVLIDFSEYEDPQARMTEMMDLIYGLK